MTTKQSELWKTADKAMQEMGGPSIKRHPDSRKEGSKVWAICEAYGYCRGQMPDDEICQKLIDIIKKG